MGKVIAYLTDCKLVCIMARTLHLIEWTRAGAIANWRACKLHYTMMRFQILMVTSMKVAVF
jgi:hypothetical protein